MVLILLAVVGYFAFTKKWFRLICFVLIYIVGLGISFLATTTYTNYNYHNQKVVLTGRVVSINSVWEDSAYITIQNVVVNIDGKTHSLAGSTKLSLYNYQADTIDVGDKLAFESVIKCVDIFEDMSYVYKYNIKYTTSVNYSKVQVVDGKLTLTESIMNKTKQNLFDTMGEDSGAVAYAILFGDKTLIDQSIQQSFRDSGTAHLLAVSGLHVGFLISLLYFVIDLLKINKYVKVSILAFVLLVYCFMCGFAPSVVRASIMGIVFVLCKAACGRYDSLSSLGLSCIVILLFKPLYLFDVGFLMSFSAALGIILLNKLLDKFKIKNKFLHTIFSILWLTLVAQIGVLPVVAGYFGTLATYSIIANLFIVPIFGIGYVLLCITNLIVLVMPFMSFIMIIPKGIFDFILVANNFISSLPGAMINIFGFTFVGGLLFYLLIFVLSRFVMTNKKIKSIICCVLAVVCVSIIVVVNIPTTFTNNTIRFASSGYTSLLTTNNNKKLLIDVNIADLDLAKQNLIKQKVNKLDAIIFTTNYNFSISRLSSFVEDFGKPTIYVYKGHRAVSNIVSSGFKVVEFDSDKEVLFDKVVLCGYKLDDKYIATKLELNGKEILFVDSDEINEDSNIASAIDNRVDILVSNGTKSIQQIIEHDYYIKTDNLTKYVINLA